MMAKLLRSLYFSDSPRPGVQQVKQRPYSCAGNAHGAWPRRDGDGELGAAAVAIGGAHFAIFPLRDGVDDVETKAADSLTAAFCSHVRFKDRRQQLRRDTGALIGDHDLSAAVLAAGIHR